MTYGLRYTFGTMTLMHSVDPITIHDIARAWTLWNPVSDDLLPKGKP